MYINIKEYFELISPPIDFLDLVKWAKTNTENTFLVILVKLYRDVIFVTTKRKGLVDSDICIEPISEIAVKRINKWH